MTGFDIAAHRPTIAVSECRGNLAPSARRIDERASLLPRGKKGSFRRSRRHTSSSRPDSALMGALPELVHPYAPYGLHLVSAKVCCYVQAEAVAAFRAVAVSGTASRPSLTARNSCAFTATMRVDKLIAMAPTLMGSSTLHRRNRPAATGIATKLYAVAQTRF